MIKAKKLVIAYIHTHWDREWYRTKEEFNLRLIEVLDEALNELETGAMGCFYFDGQTAALEDYLKFRPLKIEVIKKLIKEKKLFTGPFFASPDSFLVSCASLVKNLDRGIKYSESLGVSDFIGYLSDTFGHSKGIFDVLKSFGIDKTLLWRGVEAIPANFMTNGVKASRLVQGYYMDVLHSSKTSSDKALALESILDKINEFSGDILLLPIGADHLAVLKDSINMVNEVNKYLKNYEIKLSSPFEYLENVDFTGFQRDGEFLDNSETYILPGVYSSRIPQKVVNAKLQFNLFRIIEPLNYFLKAKYFPSIEYATGELIKNHAHDSIYGCSVDAVHKHVQDRFDKVSEVADGIKHRLIRDFKRSNADKSCLSNETADLREFKDAKNSEKVGVFNLSNFEYSGVAKVVTHKKCSNMQLVRKYSGFEDEILYGTRRIPVTEDYCPLYEYVTEVKALPSFSFSVVEDVKSLSMLEISDNKISNANLELTIERLNDKFNINFKDKKTGDILNNALEILITKDVGDSYNYAPASKPHLLGLIGTKVIEKGPFRARLRLIYENKNHVDVLLSNASEFFEFEAKINNNKKNQKIQASFNLKTPVISTIAEDTAGLIDRKHDPDSSLYDSMPVKTRGELKTNSYPMQRFVTAQGTGVLTEGLNEYEIYKNAVKIALLRGTGLISTPKNPARFVPAGPPIETPDLQCLGIHNFRFAFAFNREPKSFFRLADIFMGSTVAFLGNFNVKMNREFAKNIDENIIFYGLKQEGDRVLGIFYNLDNVSHRVFETDILPKTLKFIEFELL